MTTFSVTPEEHKSMTATGTPGLTWARFVKAYAVAGGDFLSASAFAAGQAQWYGGDKIVGALKGAVSAQSRGDSNIAYPIATDLANWLRGRTVLGQAAGLRRVPPYVRMVDVTSPSSAGGFIAEGAAIPVTSLDVAGTTLAPMKSASIAVISSELARAPGLSAETTIRDEVGASIIHGEDVALLDPVNAGVPDVSPASITYNATAHSSSGVTASAIDADLQAMIRTLTDAEMPLDTAVWVMHPQGAAYLAGLRSGDTLAFPGMTARGGMLLGLPVLTSKACAASGSPGERFVALFEAAAIAVADDNGFDISLAQQAALQLDDAPADGEQQLVSLWQHNLIGIRVIHRINWAVRRAGAVTVLRDCNW